MSYNPAFVSDESPLADSNGRQNHDQSNGIKLISFKILPKAAHNSNLSKQQQHVALDMQDAAAAAAAADKHQVSSSNRFSSSAAATQKRNGNHQANCLSTSSSLSLIDNPTLLSSLTPSGSASSSCYTSSSIVSSSLGLCAAVECRDMRYDVRVGASSHKTILHDINVTVPEGSIYGLLGPSGCGKTTMLRCVVGRIKPKSGTVRVFGYRPNDSGSQIPGPAIGYMPQVSTDLSMPLIGDMQRRTNPATDLA